MQRDGAVKPDTVGPPVDGVELKMTPQREILVRSPGLFREYHGDPARTAQAKNAEGWFHTGDAGYLGPDGQLRIIDRMANVGALQGRHAVRATAARKQTQIPAGYQGGSGVRRRARHGLRAHRHRNGR